MSTIFDYDSLVTRNSGYISAAAQQKIRSTRLLIAGCGIGSSPAVCAARMGFSRFILVDGDTVDHHNLNRQFYDFADVGRPKVHALRDQILRINPDAEVEAIAENLTSDNTSDIVSRSDIVFDTVDFLDLKAILNLHESARSHGVRIFTALSVGFGALVWHFAPSAGPALPEILASDFEAARQKGGGEPSYASVFANFIARLAPFLDAEVVEQVSTVVRMMNEGKPCPASQVAVGSFAIGALALSLMVDVIEGRPLPTSPELIVHSFRSHRTQIVNLASGSSRAL